MPVSLEERRLAAFVDRIHEMDRFCKMLDGDEIAVMVVCGETGIGKSTLLARMQHECAQRQLHKSEIICKETRNDYLSIMRKIRDDVGVQHFVEFTDLVNYFTDATYQPKVEVNVNLQGGSIQVASDAAISDSSVRDIAGVVIRDNMFVAPRPDLATPDTERMLRLTDRFILGLNRAALEGEIVILFDEMEHLASTTEKWLWEELLDALRDCRLKGVKFVLCGEKAPELDQDWQYYAETAPLKPLTLEHIAAYLNSRGIEDPGDNVAKMLLVTTQGKIGVIAAAVDAFKKMN